MIRSLLFAPGDSEKKMGKAATIGADCVILDLEDSVAESRKPLARDMVCQFLTTIQDSDVEFYVRVNPTDSRYCKEDIAKVIPSKPTGIVLPKANGPEDVLTLTNYLDILEAEHGLTGGDTKILPVATETAAAVFTLGSYAGLTSRLSGLTWGAEDLGAAVGASVNLQLNKDWTTPYLMVRALCLFGAHAAEVQAIDTVMADFKDLDQLKRVCDEARKDGFTGKIAIHPAQVPIINKAFSPSKEEIEHAKAVLAVFEENPNAGTLQLNGKMIDKPHIVQANRIVTLADQIAKRKG
ncbi:MAG: CoA ester lyase [Pseudomonadota bacterium]|nr:CoA ester lyase [Pseudomonadota bacterium]